MGLGQIARMLPTGRLSGLLLPVFSFRSRTDFGIGDFGAMEGLFRWMSAARQKLLMVLPLLPTAPGDSSPYATRSAFGLNPLFIDLHQVPEFQATGGEAALSDEQKHQLAEARAAHRVRYDLVFPLKDAAFARAFNHFEGHEWGKQTPRAREFQAWREAQGEWLESYALFTAISEEQQRRAWGRTGTPTGSPMIQRSRASWVLASMSGSPALSISAGPPCRSRTCHAPFR
jgi:4-alpha-glucanotransferase